MRIVFDARWIFENPSGIGVYAREMISRLPEIIRQCEFTAVFGSEEIMKREVALAGLDAMANVHTAVFPYGPLSVRSQLCFPRFLRSLNASVYHSPNYMIPFCAFMPGLRAAAHCVVNIHDVIPLAVEDYAPNSRTCRMKRVYRLCLKTAVAQADAVITGSRASMRDMRRLLHLSDRSVSKIHVVYDGADTRAAPLPSHEGCTAPHSSERTILYVGRMDPYKNVTGLVRAVHQAAGKLPFPLKLIVAGQTDSRYPQAPALASELGVNAVFTGFISDEALSGLYRSSDMLVHPSLYEGFGLQIVEAMQNGLPVCCTDGGSQPEICADAGVVVPAGNVGAMASAIVSCLSDPQKLLRMREAGLKRASLFTWEETARRTAEIIMSLR